jgi:hypothetical protein
VLGGVGVLVFQAGVLGVGGAEARGFQGLFEHGRNFGRGEGGLADAVDGVQRRGVAWFQQIERRRREVLHDAEVFGLAAEGHLLKFPNGKFPNRK